MQLNTVRSNQSFYHRLALPTVVFAGLAFASAHALAGPEFRPTNPLHVKPAHTSLITDNIGDGSGQTLKADAATPPMPDRNHDLGQDDEIGHAPHHDSQLISSLVHVDRTDKLKETVVDGITTSLGDLKPPLPPGTIIHFWASWCRPCEEEIPQMERFYRAHIEQDPTAKGIRLITISNDREIAPAARFIAKHGTTFPVDLDTGQTTNLAMVGKRTLPSTVMVGADGRFHRLALGKLDWDYPRLPDILAITAGHKPDAGNSKAAEKQRVNTEKDE